MIDFINFLGKLAPAALVCPSALGLCGKVWVAGGQLL